MAERFVDGSEEPLLMLPPMAGYEKYPLVTLEEAVKPVVSLVPEVNRMVWMAKQRCDESNHDMTLDESASITLYTMEWEPTDSSFYYILNSDLRSKNRKMFKGWFLYLKLFLTALYKLPSLRQTVYRGVTGDMGYAYHTGKTIVWWGFSSCSLSLEVLQETLGSEEQTIFSIQCLNGKKIARYSFYQAEEEVLLLAGTSLRVVSTLKMSSKLTVIQLEEIVPPFPLFAPPNPVQSDSCSTKVDALVARKSSTVLSLCIEDDVKEQKHGIIRFADISEERERSIERGINTAAISGIDNVSLVSIEEAINPVRSILHDVDHYTTIAKQKSERIKISILSRDQTAAIMLYTMEWTPTDRCLYHALNSTLRLQDEKKLKPWLLYLRLIFSALAALPSVRTTVFRGIKKDISKDYPEGDTFIWWGFSSCTSKITTLEAETFFGKTGTRTLFSIKCESGKQIQQFSAFPNENEVVIPAGTQFRVVAVLQIPPDVHMVQVEEVHASLLSKAFHVSGYENPRLEKLIERLNDANSDLNLSDFGEINPNDISVIVHRAFVMKQCSVIHLVNNKITAEGVRVLADGLKSNASVKELNLARNSIGDEGVKYLVQALSSEQSQHRLTSLNMSFANIGDEGASYLSKMLRIDKMITHLNLSNNRLRDRSVTYLIQGIVQNTHSKLINLNLSYNEFISDDCIEMVVELIQQSYTLQGLDLRGTLISSKGKRRIQNIARGNDHFNCHLNDVSEKRHFCSVN